MNLTELICAWQGKRAYVVGDAIIDRYQFGEVSRVCPEGPVPVFVRSRAEMRRGGAANVAANLEAWGLEVDSTYGNPWSIKTRYMVGSHLLLRVDEDATTATMDEDLQEIRKKLKSVQVLVLSDYAKGTLSSQWCRVLIGAARELGIPIVVDPKGTQWEKYEGATVLCPNESEWQAVNCHQPDGIAILAKHGEKGLAVVKKDASGTQHVRLFPARARHVFDVTGAGDTVVAAVAATLAAGGTLEDAAQIANAAAGMVVGEIGTAVCPLPLLKKLIA